MNVTTEKETYCHTCNKWFHYLGIAKHRSGHRNRNENCKITMTNGDTYNYEYAVQTRREPIYRDCERCDGLGTVMENTDHPIEEECPDCDGEGKVDQRGFAPSYSAEQGREAK